MKISLIAAIDEKRGLGKGNELLWRIPEDLKNFKKMTMGHCVLLGRKTYQSIGRALPGRTLLVLTKKESLELPDGVLKVSSVKEALEMARSKGDNELMVAGGAEVYNELLPMAETLYLTRIHGSKEADVFFPTFKNESWELSSETFYPLKGQVPPWTFQVLNRKV